MLMSPPLGSLACPPRFATPRNPERATFGHLVAEVAVRLGTPLMPWQQYVADVAFEYDADGFAYDEVDVWVPRQSGKTTLIMSKTLMRLILMVRSHGPQRSTYVAQKRLDARKKFERDFAPTLRRAGKAFPEVDHPRMRPKGDSQWRLSLNNGSEAIEFGTGSWWQIGVPDDSGGHGDTLDDATIDEARFQETSEVEEGLRPSQATRRDAQLWVDSTAGTGGSFGTKNSIYLWRKVTAGRKASEGRVAYFEWSAPEDADDVASWGDPAVWRMCMPALGLTIEESFVRGEWERALRSGQEGIDVFRRAYLNQWPEIPTVPEDRAVAAFDMDVWATLADPAGERGSTPAFGVAVAPDRSWAAIGAAWARPDGLEQVELVEYRPTTTWVKQRVGELEARWGAKTVAHEDAIDLLPDPDPEQKLSGPEQRRAHHGFDDAFTAKTLRHDNAPALNTSVRAAQWRKQGDSRVLDRSGSVDISPLHAVALALHALRSRTPPESVYEERGMVSL